MQSVDTIQPPKHNVGSDDPLEQLRESIAHAAHALPAQGPITAFVHHNTLHALEELDFEQAVVEGARTFGCHPYLPEERYREKLARNRIGQDDIDAVLMDDLGENADQLLGFLGTRFYLRQAMLRYPLYTGPKSELRWVIAETDALREFRAETPVSLRSKFVNSTRHWIMRDLYPRATSAHSNGNNERVEDGLFREVRERFGSQYIGAWDEQTWRSVTLNFLWLICRNGINRIQPASRQQTHSSRHRDLVLEATGVDSDEMVHEFLIRYCASFLDQGFAQWPLVNRSSGLFHSFLDYISQPFGPPDRWLKGIRAAAIRLRNEGITPIESISESLTILGVDADETSLFIEQTLLALRGFAGMIWQTETRGDRVAHPTPPGTLVDFLAVRLLLERFALAFVARTALGYQGALNQLRNVALSRTPNRPDNHLDQRAFVVFQLAQQLGWPLKTLADLSDSEWESLVREIESFSSLERRRIFHLAFERRYRCQTLNAVAAHSRKIATTQPVAEHRGRPKFQAIFCIDEREESFRRHLEEILPECETFGAAGFFSIAMYYRGAADAHYVPLCPVIIQPNHYVTEDVVLSLEDSDRRRRKRRHAIGTITHRIHVGSRALAGGWMAAVLGSLASFPLVARILFPRLTAQWRRVFGEVVRPPAVTRLQLERTTELPGSHGSEIGYSIAEMATIVERLLRDIGLTESLSRLVFMVGHGSSSMNNPHEAAHDCGACGGGRGGPNARAFAEMANDPRVRRRLAENGLELPEDTFFIGTYHNTCDDSLGYYDLDRIPASHREEFSAARIVFDETRQRNAHERCRRFETAPLDIDLEAALMHVEGRAEDLSQVRPEYGHATNALCFVGRRDWSKGLFLDRRAFLQSYEPAQDDEKQSILTRILQAVIPVCAGINLEYYFSYVDPTGYGCGTKLPHNIVSLLGVMNGAASDLRPGLPWQMVEIHEPVRLLFVIETTPEAMQDIMADNEGIDRLVRGEWVQLATLDPLTSEIHLFYNGDFVHYGGSLEELPEVDSSIAWYRGWRDHLGFASVLQKASR